MKKLREAVLKIQGLVDTQRDFGNTSRLLLMGQYQILDKVMKLIDASLKAREPCSSSCINYEEGDAHESKQKHITEGK